MKSTIQLFAVLICTIINVPICTASSAPDKFVTVAAGASYALYSFAIDKYAARVVKRMQDVPTPEKLRLLKLDDEKTRTAGQGNAALPLPSQLRETVSKRTNVVAKYEDRMGWNQWIAAASPSKIKAMDLLALCGISHRFKYRSYANFEEAGAICKPFYTWKRFGFMIRRPGELKFVSLADDAASGENKEGTLAFVTIKDEFLLGLFFQVRIQWWGGVMQRDQGNKYCIEWTKTEAEITLPGGKKIVKENPKMCTELSSIPWDIEKVEDGMICFRRGDIGHLAYDSK